MSIQVSIEDVKIVQDGLALAITSTNDTQPGRVVRYEKSYPTNLTAAQIKMQINTGLTLLWTAVSVRSWII